MQRIVVVIVAIAAVILLVLPFARDAFWDQEGPLDHQLSYLKARPDGPHAVAAREIADSLLWQAASDRYAVVDLYRYLELSPSRAFGAEARAALEERRWAQTAFGGGLEAYASFRVEFPDSKRGELVDSIFAWVGRDTLRDRASHVRDVRLDLVVNDTARTGLGALGLMDVRSMITSVLSTSGVTVYPRDPEYQLQDAGTWGYTVFPIPDDAAVFSLIVSDRGIRERYQGGVVLQNAGRSMEGTLSLSDEAGALWSDRVSARIAPPPAVSRFQFDDGRARIQGSTTFADLLGADQPQTAVIQLYRMADVLFGPRFWIAVLHPERGRPSPEHRAMRASVLRESTSRHLLGAIAAANCSPFQPPPTFLGEAQTVGC